MENRDQHQTLSRAFLTTTWIFQLVAAGPIFVWLGLAAIFNMFYTFDRAYDFVTHLCSSLFAAGIFFIVLVQRKLSGNDTLNMFLTLKFELAKSGFATALWVWLILDAVLGPEDHYGYRETRRTRVIAAAVSSLLLFTLFYPTVVLVIRDQRLASQHNALTGEAEDGERAPLLHESRAEST